MKATSLRGGDVPVNSESRYKLLYRSPTCSDLNNLDSNADLTNFTNTTNDTYTLVRNLSNLYGKNERRPQELNSTLIKSHSEDSLIEKNDNCISEDNFNGNTRLRSSPCSSNKSGVPVTPNASTSITNIIRDSNEIGGGVPSNTTVPSHIKRIRFPKRFFKSEQKKKDTNAENIINSDTDNDDNASTVVRKRGTRKAMKLYIRKKIASKPCKLKEEIKLLGKNSKKLIKPHPVTLNLGPNNQMQFFYEKRGKISRLTKGKGKRKNGYFNKPPKSRAAAIINENDLPRVTRMKTKFVVRKRSEVMKSMEQRMAKTRIKVESDECVLSCGMQIFATRHSEQNDNFSITAATSAKQAHAKPAPQNLIQDRTTDNCNCKETVIDDAGEEIEEECKSLPNNSSTTGHAQTCIKVSDSEEQELNNVVEGELSMCTPDARACGTTTSKSPTTLSDKSNQQIDDYSQWYVSNYSTAAGQIGIGNQDIECVTGKRVMSVAIPRGIAPYLYVDYAVLNTRVKPVNKMACVDHKSKIYVCDIGLTSSQCDFIVNVAEHCSTEGYASYTYAKQTLGCRDHDEIAAVCEWPVMRACSTIQTYLESGSDKEGVFDEALQRDLVLDEREPHVVKYDISRVEHQKLDMHTDKSEWTFLISLSDGDGRDYEGGGTFFESINSTVHLQKGHALLFPGKLRHRGQKIIAGTRFLLVGFLVEKRFEIPYLFD